MAADNFPAPSGHLPTPLTYRLRLDPPPIPFSPLKTPKFIAYIKSFSIYNNLEILLSLIIVKLEEKKGHLKGHLLI